MNDKDHEERRPDEDDEDYPRRARPAFRDSRSRLRSKQLSVLGLIALIIGVISLALSLVPCLGLFTIPLPILGAVLALTGVLISAIGQREGLGIPLWGVGVNLVACVVPIVLFMGLCGLGMRGAQQATQQAVQAMQAEADRLQAERDQQVATSVAGVVGLLASPQPHCAFAGLAGLYELADKKEPPAFLVDTDLDQLLLDYETNPQLADVNYLGKTLRLQGTIESVGKEGNYPFVVLWGQPPRGTRLECEFDDHDLNNPRVAQLKQNQQVTIQGDCAGRPKVGSPVRLTGCRLGK